MDPLNSCAQASHFLFLDLTLPISKVRQQFSQKILPGLTFEDSVNTTAQTSREEDIPTRILWDIPQMIALEKATLLKSRKHFHTQRRV